MPRAGELLAETIAPTADYALAPDTRAVVSVDRSLVAKWRRQLSPTESGFADQLSPDEWETIATHVSMHGRASLIALCRSARDGVVRSMAVAHADGASVKLLHDQTWARISAVLLGRSLFLTGGAGVGKTTVSTTILRDLRTWFESPDEHAAQQRALRAHHEAAAAVARGARVDVPPKPPKRRVLNVMTTASTGAAARLISGRTLHSAFNVRIRAARNDRERVLSEALATEEPLVEFDAFAECDDFDGTGDAPPDQKPGEWSIIALTPGLKRDLRKLDVLLIDEVSMVDGDLLSLIDTACRKARGVERPFGGVLVLLVGDFCQLAPVITEVTARDGGNHGFAFLSNAWRALAPRVVDLVVPVRQDAGDPARARFIELLGRWRKGWADWKDVNWLMESRHRTSSDTELGLLLTTRTDIRKQRNETMLAELAGESHARDAAQHRDCCDRFSVLVGGEDARSGEQFSSSDPRAWETVPRPSFRVFHDSKAADKFEFKVGARVRCTRNTYEKVRGERQLLVANGAVGTILDFKLARGSGNLVEKVSVHWDKVSRTVDAFTREHEPTWHDRVQSRRYLFPPRGHLPLKASRRQLPLEICFAKTIHSAQGSSVFEPTDLCIDRNRAKKQPGKDVYPKIHGIVYTAISRFASEKLIRVVKSKEGKPLRICCPDDVFCDPAVAAFYSGSAERAPAWLSTAVGVVKLA